MKCAIYTRVSSNKQVEKGYSLEAQGKVGIDICKKKGWEYEIFAEEGKSADKETISNRPVLEKILELAGKAEIDYCFATELDRLSRNPVALALIKKVFSENGVKVATVNQIFDFKDDDDDFLSDLLGILAKRENRIRVRRSQRGLKESILKGNWFGINNVAFGYTLKDKRLVPDKEEAEIYKLMVKWCVEGMGVQTIARRLHAMNIPTKATKVRSKGEKVFKWKHGSVWRILKNPVYKGEFVFKGDKVKTPSLITPRGWEQVQESLLSHSNFSMRNTKHFYLLRGLLKCKKCGRSLIGRILVCRSMRVYMCASKKVEPYPSPCGLKNVNIDKLNKVVWESIKSIIANSQKLKEAIGAREKEDFVDQTLLDLELSQIDKALKEKEIEKKRLLELYTKGLAFDDKELSDKARCINQEKDKLMKQREGIIDQISNKKQQQKVLDMVKDMSRELKARMDTFTDEEKQRFLRLVVDKIVVDYDEGKKEHTIEIQGAIPIFDDPRLNAYLTSSSDTHPLRQCGNHPLHQRKVG